MKIFFNIAILLSFYTTSLCQKLYFPISNFADSASLAKNFPTLAKQVIAQYKEVDSTTYYYNLFRLQIVAQNYLTAVKTLDTWSGFLTDDTSSAKAIFFHYRTYSLAANAYKSASNKSFSGVYHEIFT